MYNKKVYFPGKLRSLDHSRHRKNGKTLSVRCPEVITETAPCMENLNMLQERKNHISDLERKVEELKIKLNEVVRTNSKFISIIAHDLRSPFNAILVTLELIKSKLENYNLDDLENYVDMASVSATRTLRLLDDLLDWTISQNAHNNLNPVKLNLGELVEEQIEDLHGSVNQKQLSINHFIPSDLNVTADLQMVKTIFRNLIGNAIKYTNEGGKISISTAEVGQFVKTTVSDTGIGISQAAQKQLYKMETLQKTNGTNNEPGSGFGLILCKEFIEAHGGTLSLESEPGKGSKFMFTMPRYI